MSAECFVCDGESNLRNFSRLQRVIACCLVQSEVGEVVGKESSLPKVCEQDLAVQGRLAVQDRGTGDPHRPVAMCFLRLGVNVCWKLPVKRYGSSWELTVPDGLHLLWPTGAWAAVGG